HVPAAGAAASARGQQAGEAGDGRRRTQEGAPAARCPGRWKHRAMVADAPSNRKPQAPFQDSRTPQSEMRPSRSVERVRVSSRETCIWEMPTSSPICDWVMLAKKRSM